MLSWPVDRIQKELVFQEAFWRMKRTAAFPVSGPLQAHGIWSRIRQSLESCGS